MSEGDADESGGAAPVAGDSLAGGGASATGAALLKPEAAADGTALREESATSETGSAFGMQRPGKTRSVDPLSPGFRREAESPALAAPDFNE